MYRTPEIPYTTLHHGLKVSSSLAITVISTKPCPPLIPVRDLKGSMELATTEVRRSPRSLIASCQQAAELEEAGYSQARDRQIRARPQSPDRRRLVPRRNHRTRKSLRCQTRFEPRRPRSISASVSSTLPDSSLRSIDVRVPQASTPTVFSGTWLARTEPGHSASHPPLWGSQDRPQRLHAVAQSAPPCRPGQSGPGRRRHLPGCRVPAG